MRTSRTASENYNLPALPFFAFASQFPKAKIRIALHSLSLNKARGQVQTSRTNSFAKKMF